MKEPEEYLKEVNSFTTREELYNIGAQMQLEAYNEALLDAIKNVKLIGTWGDEDLIISSLNTRDYNGEWMDFTISNKSILELKK
jgi:hypothetical protein